MRALTDQQAVSLLKHGFDRGLRGFPVLFADNGTLTIVEESSHRATVWVFEPAGAVLCRDYVRDGGYDSTISTVLR